MSDLFEDPDPEASSPAGDNAPEFTVSELSGAVKRAIEGGFARVRVRGEVGRVSRPRSGHVYLDLKDDRAVLAGVIWKGQAARLETQPEEGLEVVATGRLTTFAGQSKYQIVIDSLAPAGVGALMAMLEKRRRALEAEGLFAAERKRALPFLPRVIGVVTSPSGAVIRDILHRLRDRFPRHVLIWPVAVQGERCAPEVVRAIAGFNALAPDGPVPRPDLLIVARGGGSVEDLWGFNDEAVVRAAAGSAIPLISAVGHETDTTLIDFAADRRAPTPSAAAELAVPVRADLLAWSEAQGGRLRSGTLRGLRDRRQRLRDLARALPRPQDLTQAAAQRLDTLGDRLPRALVARCQAARLRLGQAHGALRPRALARQTAHDRSRLSALGHRLDAGLSARLVAGQGRLEAASGRLSLRQTRARLAREPQVLAGLTARLARAARTQVAGRRGDLDGVARLLDSRRYRATLRRGFAVVRTGDRVLTCAADARAARRLEVEFADGRVGVLTEGAGPARAAAGGGRGSGPGQPSLFDDEA